MRIFPSRRKARTKSLTFDGPSGIPAVPFNLLDELAPLGSLGGLTGGGTLLPAEQVILHHPAVQSTIGLVASGAAASPFRVLYQPDPTTQPTPVRDTRLADALAAPDLVYRLTFDLLAYGECFAVMTGGRSFIHVSPPLVSVQGEGAEVTGYEIGGKEYPPEQVLHVKRYNGATFNLLRGSSPLRGSIRGVIIEDLAAWRARRAVWGGAGIYARRPLEAPDWSPQALSRFSAALTTHLRGRGQPGDVPVIEDGMELDNVPLGEAAATWAQDRRLVWEIVASLYNVPAALIAAAPSDRNMDSAARSLVTDSVEPVVNLLAGEITRQAVPAFYPDNTRADRIVVTADTTDRTRDRFAARCSAYALALGNAQAPGWMTPDEVREAEGLDGPAPQWSPPAARGTA